MASKWEVLDSYGIPVFTGTLRQCGVWIDPVLGVHLKGGFNQDWPTMPDTDEDRITRNDDGTITVDMYVGPGGVGGQLTVRKVE